MKKLLIVIIGLILLSSCSQKQSVMIFPDTEWEKATPESQDIDSEKLDRALSYLESKSLHDKIRQMVIVRNGYLIHEGEQADSTHNIWSCSKTFTSTTLGIMIDQGLINLDDYAADFEPLLKEKYSKVTFRHFASMTSGYSAEGRSRWSTVGYADWSWTPYKPEDPYFAPGTEYAYWDEAQMMFGRVLTRILNRSMQDYLTEHITNPIGIEEWSWWPEGDFEGIPINNGCTNVTLNAKQFARWGHLFLNKGNWNGKQLISEEWVNMATTVQVGPEIPVAETDRKNSTGSGSYGFNWWVNGIQPDGTRKLPNAPPSTYWARGLNSNWCVVVPEWNMVIIRMGEDGHPPEVYKVWNEFFRLLQKAIID